MLAVRILAAWLLVIAAVFAAPPGLARADAIRDQEWYLNYLNLTLAQRVSTGKGVVVAVVDSGVDGTHPDLIGSVLPGLVSYLGPGRTGDAWHDSTGHGTGMAGNIVAHGHGSGAGTIGVAPGAKILPIGDTIDGGRTTNAAIAAGIDDAVQQGATVICVAEGGGGDSQLLSDAVRRAEASGAVLVAGVGNRSAGSLAVAAPADLPGVVAVASVDRKGNHVADSVTGSAVVLSAPGVDIVHPAPGGGYSSGTGTSDATSITAGAVALVRAKYPGLSAAEVIHRLTATATDKGPPGRDDEYGYGVINIVAALTADVPPLSSSASPSPTGNDQPANNPSPSAQRPADTRSALPFVVGAVAVILALLAILGWRLTRRRAV